MASSPTQPQIQPQPEPVAIGSLKHDPAWHHCQMFKNGERVQLKCLYCLKVFSGGGIHRIKEHLACQKGNASCCPKVPPEVRRAMLQSLEVVIVKKRKKQKLADDIRNITPESNGNRTVASQDANTGLELVPVSNGVEASGGEIVTSDDGVKNKSLERRKRGRLENFYPVVTPSTSPHPIGDGLVTVAMGNEKDQVVMSISRFFYDVGLPIDAVKSPYFRAMVDTIVSNGSAFEVPSYHDLRGWVLKNSLDEVNGLLEKYRSAWGRNGCSVLADELTLETGRTLLNFFVYCSEGTMFLRSYDVSDTLQSSDVLYDLFKSVIDEIGESNVLQLVTDGAEHYVNAGKRLAETIRTMYWTPCASRSISLMLEDIGKIDWINETLEEAKSVTRFVYNHGTALNMMRRYTGGRDLVQPMMTRSATDFFTLKSMASLKDNLQVMVNSQEWIDCPLSKLPEGYAMMDVILKEAFWSSCSSIVDLTDPLVGVLRSIDSAKRPATGYILADMHHVKEIIKNEVFEKVSNIIDSRWDLQFQHPLHEAGFFLNPRLYYSLEGDVRDKIPSGMLDCIERLVPDITIQDKINKELISYKNAVGDFGRKMAIRATHTLLPAEWWSTYGGGCPNLSRLAIRILSQTCSASVCKITSPSFEQFHRTKNHLERQRLSDLLFVQYNLRLQQINLRKNQDQEPMDPISADKNDLTEDWVTEKAEFYRSGDSGWAALHQPVGNSMLLEPPNDEPESLIAGFDYQERKMEVRGDDEG